MTAVVRYPRPDSLPPPGARFVVVEASAGTGKTFFLEHRIADLIVAGARLDELLVVTFTDKAVAELRLRVRDLLDRMSRATESSDAASAWELDADTRARLRAAVNAFDRAPIFTIHGFCHRVLVEDAFAARRLLVQEQISDELAFERAFRSVLAERFAKDEPDRTLLATYLARDKTVEQLRALLLSCTRATSPARAYDPAAASSLGERLRAQLGDPDAVVASLRLKATDAKYVRTRLGKLADAFGDGASPVDVLAACGTVRDPLEELVERLVRVSAPAALIALVREAATAPTLDEAIAGHFLPPVLARAGLDKAEAGELDYDDMLRVVRDTLCDPVRGGDLAARLRSKTPWVLIDEFQDTDPVQWDIFRTVWMDDAAKGLAIVGDPKQAIYSFRGADVATYLSARKQLHDAGATRVVLDTNRRSTDALVAAVNTLLTAPLPQMLQDPNSYDDPVKPSGTITCEDGGRPPIAVFALRGPGRDDNRVALAQAIAREIERLRDTAPVVRCRGEARAFSLAQIMVLTRSNKDSLQIAGALRSRGLPCELRESDKLFETREADELAAVLAAVAAPRDRSARMRALRTRFFDVPWAELMRVVDAPDHHPAIARLYAWASLATRRQYEQLFRRVFEDSRFAERALVLGGGERALVNTWHVIELLLEEVARTRCDLHELVDRLRGWMASEHDQPGERDVQRIETDADAIRVLTIHKAKGLEAPYVFVYGAASPPPPRQLPWRRSDDTAENERLAYVALTRAQCRLYLPSYGDKTVDARSMYVPVQRCLPPAIATAPQLFETIDVLVPATADPEPPAGALVELDVPPVPAVAALAELPAARQGLDMLSYTRLAREHEVATIEASEPRAHEAAIVRAELDAGDDAETELPPDQLPPGLDSGLYLHDVLEHVDLESVRRTADATAWAAMPATRALLAEHARARGIPTACLPHAAQLVHATLTAPITVTGGDDLPPLVAAHALAREVEFAYPIPGAPARGLVKGFIDVLVAWGDELWVLDYKSDTLASPANARAHVDEHYAVQAKLYALAADRMRGARRLAGMLFSFVRHGVTVAIPAPPDKLEQWTGWLAGLREAAP